MIMETRKNKRTLISPELLYKASILLLSVACIVYFLPRDQRNNYHFEENRPWPYGQVMADFDFPIYKDEGRIQQEQDSIMAGFSPYCQQNDTIPVRQVALLRQRLTSLDPAIPSEQIADMVNSLRNIYAKGILASEEYATFSEDTISNIMVYTQKTASRQALSQTYSTKQAYELMMGSDSLHLNKVAMQRIRLIEIIQPNLFYDQQKSDEVRQDLLSSISLTTSMVLRGTKIVDRGEIVTPQLYRILESWKIESNKRTNLNEQNKLILIGQIIFATLIIASFILYLTLFRNDYFDRQRSVLLLFSLIVLFPVITSLMVRNNLMSVYIIPYAMAPMIIRIFMDSRTAFMSLITLTLLSSMTLRFPYEFILVQILSGLVSILSLRELSQRSQLFRSALLISGINIIFYFGFELIHENDLSKLDINMYKYLGINGILLLFTYPLLYLLEKTFGFTSDVTLVELSNINTPLLQRLSEVAPGTFQHSMQVANLAAEVAKKIGAKSQLVRTGALYHDIGKMENAVFFTENQSGVNPHSALNEIQSAHIVINHVNDGLKLAEKAALPKVIKDFISTHHGKGVAKYFFINYKNAHPNENIDQSLFTYPGPNPFTKEQAILMMADAVEAASRSLPEYTEESIGKLVDKIVDQQVNEGFFALCPITFLDIATAKHVFKEKLKTIYHTRISYPELKK